jgi:hypothetical protein
MFRTKQDTARQAISWIKDKVETTTALSTDEEVSAKAIARLNELKQPPKKGTAETCVLPTLQPGEKLQFRIPFIVTDALKVKSYTVSFGPDGISYNISIKDRETRFERIFKDRMDENVNVSPTDNPNGMTDALVFDFTDQEDYTLIGTKITNKVLSLDGGTTGTCTMPIHTADGNITHCELRILANQYLECTYQVSNNAGTTWEDITPGVLHTFLSTGAQIVSRVTLITSTGVSPEYEKVNLLYKRIM